MGAGMARERAAIERCAYCGEYVPITHVEVESPEEDPQIWGRVSVCEGCFGDGR